MQEFYEVTLLDRDKTLQEKTTETLQIASKWEKNPPISQPQPSSGTAISSAVQAQPEMPSKSNLPAEVTLSLSIALIYTVFLYMLIACIFVKV